MFNRLLRLAARYGTRHLSLRLAQGIEIRSGRLWVTRRGRAVLSHGCAEVRGDTPLSLPFDRTSPLTLSQRGAPTLSLPALPLWRWGLAHLALGPGLIRRLVSLVPLLPRRHDPHIRTLMKRRLGLDTGDPPPDLVVPGLGLVPQVDRRTRIAIILPVHNARHCTLPCLDRVAAHTDLPWQMVLVDDGSTEPGLQADLADWAQGRRNVQLITHDTAQGFTQSVNAGLDAIDGFRGPVVLLNSDVTLPKGWARRLVGPLLQDPTIASVTPLSNAGELMGAPHACAPVALRKGECDRIDAALRLMRAPDVWPDLPTGTGFCMALSPRWLAEEPRFDASLLPGYGEEVDWSQRVAAKGGRHVCQTRLYVGHIGAASYGTARRAELRAASARVIAQRYPGYDAQVTQVLAADPIVHGRLEAALIWAKTRLRGKALPVYMAHSLGGGVARWLTRVLVQEGIAAVIRVGGVRRWTLELHTPNGVTCAGTDRFDDVLALLTLAGPREVVYTCAVGDPAPEEIPARLMDLAGKAYPLRVQFHDYFPLSRDYTFRSETEPEWQALWRPVLQRAGTLEVFSDAARGLVAKALPDMVGKLRVCPHAPLAEMPQIRPLRGGPLVIGVLGDLNQHKGAEVVAALDRKLARVAQVRIVVFGAVAPDCKLPPSVQVLGGYDLDDVPFLIARHRIRAWLVPAIWPETFSFTTQEVLATGLPVVGFDLGAQGAAIHAAAQGRVVALRNDLDADVRALLGAFETLPGWPILRPRPRRRSAFRPFALRLRA